MQFACYGQVIPQAGPIRNDAVLYYPKMAPRVAYKRAHEPLQEWKVEGTHEVERYDLQ